MRGVGPARAHEMVLRWGCGGVLALLDAPPAEAEARLRELRGVGAATARQLKGSWDARAQTCAGTCLLNAERSKAASASS